MQASVVFALFRGAHCSTVKDTRHATLSLRQRRVCLMILSDSTRRLLKEKNLPTMADKALDELVAEQKRKRKAPQSAGGRGGGGRASRGGGRASRGRGRDAGLYAPPPPSTASHLRWRSCVWSMLTAPLSLPEERLLQHGCACVGDLFSCLS